MALKGDKKIFQTSFVMSSKPRAARPWTHKLNGSEANNVIFPRAVSNKGTGSDKEIDS